jgi:hypothetical protein
MAGFKLLTKLDSRTCLRVAWRVAQDLGFTLTPIGDCSQQFTASKGNLFMSMLGGPFAPHCQFQISIKTYSDSNEVVLEKNKPWLTSGAIGVSKVNRQAEELMQEIACAIEKEGGTIIERKEF